MKVLLSIFMFGFLLGLNLLTPCQALANQTSVHHVLLISVDGLHQVDLDKFIKSNPHSNLALLRRKGIEYSDALTVFPSDSFPGMIALATGGTPEITGVYYDVTYDRNLSSADSGCQKIGTVVAYDESVDKNIDNHHSIPAINPARLPLDPRLGCKPVYPYDYLKVNTIFNVARKAGLWTAWADKHPVYEILDGPGGKGINDLYTPEIGGNYEGEKQAGGDKITSSVLATENYDAKKINAVIHEIDGFTHDGKLAAPVPAIFGLNLQEINVAEKMAGYLNAQAKPTIPLENAMKNTDRLIGRLIKAIHERNLGSSTLIIVTAKHGNSPIDPRDVIHVDKYRFLSVVSKAAHGALGQLTMDDVALIWLKNHKNISDVIHVLMRNKKILHIHRILYGQSLSSIFRVSDNDERRPDIIVLPNHGVIYTKKGNKKLAEHGGFYKDDRHVPILVFCPALIKSGLIVNTKVSTTQIAPTILAALGLNVRNLDAVRIEHTKILPEINFK